MAAIVIGRERHAVVRSRAVSLMLFGGRVGACRSLHGRLVVVVRTVHARRLSWVVHLITMMLYWMQKARRQGAICGLVDESRVFI